jgi:hypothetical protein
MVEPVAPAPEPSQEPLTPAGTPSAPPAQASVDNTPAAADVEAQKNAEKLQMEINMLRKQKDTLEKEKLEREKKELEEKEDYRSLAEKAQAEAEALRKEKSDAESKAATESATKEVFGAFPENVQKVATTAGLTAQSDSDEDKATLKSKLEAIQKDVGGTAPAISGSNPAPAPSDEPFDAVRAGKLMRVDDRNIREPVIKEAVGRHPQVQAFRDYGKTSNNVAPQPS